jgi:hypothetical protein
MKLSLLALVALLFAVPAFAQFQTRQEVPIMSATRLQLGAGANYEWLSKGNNSSIATPFQKEFTVGLYGAYNIVPNVDAVAFTKYGVDNKWFNTALGVRVTFFSGGTR